MVIWFELSRRGWVLEVRKRKGWDGDEREGEGIFMEDAEMVEREDVNSEPVVEEQEQVEDDDQPQLDDSDYENLEVLESVTFVEFDGVLV